MKRYICPICEHELTAKSVCPVCRKVIRKPWVYDGSMPNEYRGNYILNHSSETHAGSCIEPNRDRLCETPQERNQDQQFSKMSSTGGTVYKRYEGTAGAPGSQIWRDDSATGKNYSAGSRSKSTSKSGNTAKKVGCGCGCGCLSVLIAIIVMILIGVSELESNWENVLGWIESEGWLEVPETVDYDEIMKAGVACNGNSHYSVQGEDVYEVLTEYAQKNMQIKAVETAEYMNNLSFSSGTDDVWTFYDRCYEWHWEDGFIEMSVDSVTGQAHYLSVYGANKNEVIALAAHGLAQLEGCNEDEVRQWLERAETDGEAFDIGNSSVYFGMYEEDGEYYFDAFPREE